MWNKAITCNQSLNYIHPFINFIEHNPITCIQPFTLLLFFGLHWLNMAMLLCWDIGHYGDWLRLNMNISGMAVLRYWLLQELEDKNIWHIREVETRKLEPPLQFSFTAITSTFQRNRLLCWLYFETMLQPLRQEKSGKNIQMANRSIPNNKQRKEEKKCKRNIRHTWNKYFSKMDERWRGVHVLAFKASKGIVLHFSTLNPSYRARCKPRYIQSISLF